jgi:hypothetical protein
MDISQGGWVSDVVHILQIYWIRLVGYSNRLTIGMQMNVPNFLSGGKWVGKRRNPALPGLGASGPILLGKTKK